MGKIAQADIQSVAFRGYGVARIGGKVIFIPYSAPGDKVRVEVTEEKKNYSIGRLKEITKPSPWRTTPRCPYFGICGGCQWQHIDPAMQAPLKKGILEEVLKRLGKIEEIPPIGLAPSPLSYGYRVRVQLKVKGRAIGYYQEKSHDIVAIDHCPISHPLINQVILLLQEDLPFFSRTESIEINVSPEEGRGVLLLRTPAYDGGVEDFLKDFLSAHPLLGGIAVMRKGKLKCIGDPYLHFTISFNSRRGEGAFRLRASATSFFQVNLEQNRSLIETVIDFGEVNERALDLYAGIGNLTIPLAMAAREAIGVEENRTAVKDARTNVERNGVKNCRFIFGRVEDVLKNWKREKVDLVILDPPRMGCKEAVAGIASLSPKRIIYVSCEPTTLARDLRLFSNNGYPLQRVALIDMFPQSYHMEVVALLQEG